MPEREIAPQRLPETPPPTPQTSRGADPDGEDSDRRDRCVSLKGKDALEAKERLRENARDGKMQDEKPDVSIRSATSLSVTSLVVSAQNTLGGRLIEVPYG